MAFAGNGFSQSARCSERKSCLEPRVFAPLKGTKTPLAECSSVDSEQFLFTFHLISK
jgi:hypothetical protein